MINSQIALRAATPEDENFLRTVFASTRSAELSVLASDSKLAEAFVDMQFNIQQQSYRTRFPAAENQIILLSGQPIGRILVDRAAARLVLVDIAILSNYRNRGVGSVLIRRLIDEAADSQKPLELSVYKFNPALRLYERLGFSQIDEEALYIRMEWLPRSTKKDDCQFFSKGANNV